MTTDALSGLPTHRERLDNGLTVVIREDHSAPVVAIVTHVRTGYLDEPDALTGISHVLEHMFFKGTPRLGPGDLGRETRALGGVLNASTGYDRTLYYTVVPSHATDRALALQADALLHSTIDEAELARELGVILQEARRKLDSPAAVAAESLYETMFDAHRLRRWRIGTEDGLSRLTRTDVLDWYRSTYRPERTVLVVAGDVDVGQTLIRVREAYSALRAQGGAPAAGPAEPARRAFRFRELSGDTQRTWLEWGWRTHGPLHEDTPLLDVLAVVLGQGRASRLYRGVREPGLASQIGARNATHRDTGVFGVSAVTEPADALDAAAAIAAEVRAVARDGVEDGEVERARSIAEARLLRTLETVQGQATLLAEWQALGDWRLFETYLERIQSATAADLVNLAGACLPLDSATVLLYRPDSARSVGAEAVEEALQRMPSPVARPGAPSTRPVPKRLNAPARRTAVDGDVEDWVLDDGARCVILPRRSAPLVSIAAVFPGGAASEDAATAGMTDLMARASLRGTLKRSGAQIAVETEALGGSIAPSVEPDTFSWSLTVPARHLETGLGLLLDVVHAPAFPADETSTERDIALARLRQERDDMFGYPIRLALEAGFDGDAYGLTLEQAEVALHAAHASRVRDWYARTVQRTAPLLVIVGDVDPDAAARLAARHVEGTDAPVSPGVAPEWAPGPRTREVRRETAQSAFAIAWPGPDRNDPDALALRLLAHAISGLGGSLFEELRSRRSLAYTVAALPVTHRRAGAFITYIATSPERVDEARSTLLQQIEDLRATRLTESELERARRYAIGTREIRQQTNAARTGELARALLLGRGVEEIRDFAARVMAVSTDAVLDAAQRWLDPDRSVEGIVYGTGGSR